MSILENTHHSVFDRGWVKLSLQKVVEHRHYQRVTFRKNVADWMGHVVSLASAEEPTFDIFFLDHNLAVAVNLMHSPDPLKDPRDATSDRVFVLLK